MSQISNGFVILFVILTTNSWIDCETDSKRVSNSRMTKVVEKHSESVRQWLCTKEEPITPEQWANLKSECIKPRLEELMPESAITAYEECNEKVDDICVDSQWMDGKECAKEMLKDEDVGEIQEWYRSRVRQMTENFKFIKKCYLKHLKLD